MYRKNVCVIIFNEALQFLACQRIDSDSYQCVQGGIEDRDLDDNDNGLTTSSTSSSSSSIPTKTGIIRAALREIEEEIGIIVPFEQIFVSTNNSDSNSNHSSSESFRRALREQQQQQKASPSTPVVPILKYVGEILPPDGQPPSVFRYELPRHHRLCRVEGFSGQEQRLLLFFLSKASIAAVNVHTNVDKYHVPPEFRTVRWASMDQLLQHCPEDRRQLFHKYIGPLAVPRAAKFLQEHGIPVAPSAGIPSSL